MILHLNINKFITRGGLPFLVHFFGMFFLTFVNEGKIEPGLQGLLEILFIGLYSIMLGNIFSLAEQFFSTRFENDSFKTIFLEFILVSVAGMLAFTLFFTLPALTLFKTPLPVEVILLRLRQVYIVQWVLLALAFTIRKGILIFIKYKNTQLELEILENEKIKEQLEMLKLSINPQFLFNSMDTISALIPKNKEVAARFVDELAFVYRYILEQKESKLVELRKEKEFIDSYLFLNQQMLNKHVNIDYCQNSIPENLWLAPLTLQKTFDVYYNILTSTDANHMRISFMECENNFCFELKKLNTLSDQHLSELKSLINKHQVQNKMAYAFKENTLTLKILMLQE